MTMLRAAIVQAEVADDLASALALTARLAAEAKRGGAELVIFPETWLPGYPIWLDVCRDVALWDHPPVKSVFARYAENSVDVSGSAGATLASLAAELRIVLVVGVSERVASGPGRGTLYNSLLTYGPDGALLNHHRKLVPTYTERMVWGNGDANGLHAVDAAGFRLGGLVCWEHWMPLSRQALHASGEDIHVAVWPTVHDMHQVASRHYAFEGRCFVLAAGSLMRADRLPAELAPHPDKAPTGDTLIMRGGSAIFAPDGACVAGPVFDAPVILHAELDLSLVRQGQMTLDVAGHYSRPDLFEFRVEESRPRE